MINRWIAKKLHQTMQFTPAVALLGARQVGKTTLAKMISEHQDSIYLDLESPEDLLKLSDPAAFLSMHADKLVILDEIQRFPDLFLVLRGLIDTNRQAGRKGNQYLLLGSASMDLMRQSSESLAGRISYIEMTGLHLLETPVNQPADIQKLWFRGGFPESYLADTGEQSMAWLESLVRTYLERDIPQLGFRVPANRLRRLWTMLAHLQGETINYSRLAANLEVDGKTVSHYIDILVDLLLVRRLEPWHANVKKRLVKSPRFYIRDSGIVHRLLGISDHDSLLANPVVGKSWEGFVLENILSVTPDGTQANFYRTAAGAEIDLLLRLSSTELWAIEIKKSSAPRLTRGFHQACEDVQASKKFVVYAGDDEFPIQHNTTVVSPVRLMAKLQG